jgi:allantoicase
MSGGIIIKVGRKKFTYGHFLKWMRTYKTTYRAIIPEDVALVWIAQVQQILDTIEVNTERIYGNQTIALSVCQEE